MSETDRQAIFQRAFFEQPALSYAHLRAALMEASEQLGLDLAKTRAEVFITRALQLGYLLKRREPGQRYEFYRLNWERFSLDQP